MNKFQIPINTIWNTSELEFGICFLEFIGIWNFKKIYGRLGH